MDKMSSSTSFNRKNVMKHLPERERERERERELAWVLPVQFSVLNAAL